MDDKTQKLMSEVTGRMETLRAELLDMEKTFNAKREEFLKLQGALEAIQAMSQD
jgi:predicted patatin/cPLA2 family phospholipase